MSAGTALGGARGSVLGSDPVQVKVAALYTSCSDSCLSQQCQTCAAFQGEQEVPEQTKGHSQCQLQLAAQLRHLLCHLVVAPTVLKQLVNLLAELCLHAAA